MDNAGGSGGSGGKVNRQTGSSRSQPYRKETSRQAPPPDEKVENKLYVGNLDHRVTEYHVLKMFSPFGKIRREEYLWHTHGPKRGEPRGYAFIEYSKREDAELARAQMNGRPAFGRPLVVRFVDEKVVTYNTDAPVWTRDAATSTAKPETQAVVQSNISKSAKIAAIQSKLRAMEQEDAMRAEGQAVPDGPVSVGAGGRYPGMADGGYGRGAGDVGLRGNEGEGNPRALQSRTLLQNGNRWSSWG